MPKSKVALIVPEKGNVHLTVRLINSIIYHCSYNRDLLTIYVADTGSEEKEKNTLRAFLKRALVLDGLQSKFIEYDYYNFAKINNDVVNNHIDKDTDIIILCNNDIEFITDIISETVDKIENTPDIGTVGVRLMYASDNVQHAGLLLSFIKYKTRNTFFATHFLLKKAIPLNKKYGEVESCGNTGAFMATPRVLWEKYGGLSEEYDKCYEDVHYNLACLLDGKRNITLLDSLAFHYESATRKNEIIKSDVKRINAFAMEKKSSLFPILGGIIKRAWEVFNEKGLLNGATEEENGYKKEGIIFQLEEEKDSIVNTEERKKSTSEVRYIEVGGRLCQGLSGKTGG